MYTAAGAQGGGFYATGPAGGTIAAGGVRAGGAQVAGGAGGSAGGDLACGCGPGGTQVVHTMAGEVGRLPAGATVQGGLAAGAGCAGGCLTEECTTGGMMAFVGTGAGDYVTETTYRYVGEGRGDVRFVAQKTRTYFGLALCLALLIALIVFFMTRPTSTTIKLPDEAVCEPPEDCYGCEIGRDCDRCHARNDVFCCAWDRCQDIQDELERMHCEKDRGTLDDCCGSLSGSDAAPQCGCQPIQECSGLEGDDKASCQQNNLVHCCIESKCQRGQDCHSDDDCAVCKKAHHDTCCSGNRRAPGCEEEEKRCLFWGDPHILTFDGARPSFYGDGEYWIIKNKEVFIQGRYMGTKYTYGLAATNKVAIGGPFLKGHTIEVEPMENGGAILVDGHEVCRELGSSYNVAGLATIVHNTRGQLVDEAASQFERHMVHISLPKGIHMTVFRWTNYLDLDIRMKPLEGGVDGSCGNMNGDKSDDTTQAIFDRIGARVQQGEMLLRHRAGVPFSPEEAKMLEESCHADKREMARTTCLRELETSNPTHGELNACMFDECFGMNEHALRTARIFASASDRAAAGEMSSTA